MPTTIYLPYHFQIDSINGFLKGIVDDAGNPRDTHFVFDFRSLGFIDGTGFTAFCNVLDWLKRRQVKRQFARPAGQAPSVPVRYMDDCGFFERYLGQSILASARVRSTTLPCAEVVHSQGPAWLDNRMKPWLAATLGVPEARLGSTNSCMKELFNNVLDHSTEQIANVHLQHYPQMEKVCITVSDFGSGIPVNIRRIDGFSHLSDSEAILKATEQGVTSKGNPTNMGQGLDFLITNVTGNKGSVSIYSQGGGVVCRPMVGGLAAVKNAKQLEGVYPGTLVDITLPIGNFVGDEVDTQDEDFIW